MPITIRPGELTDIPLMAAIRAQEWGTESFWTDRIGLYLSGEHSPQEALPARAAFVAMDGTKLVGFVAGTSNTPPWLRRRVAMGQCCRGKTRPWHCRWNDGEDRYMVCRAECSSRLRRTSDEHMGGQVGYPETDPRPRR